MSELSTQATIEPSSVKRVLIIRPRFVGDICITLPVVDHLRRLAPQATIDYLLEEPVAPLLIGDPRLRQVIAARRSLSPLPSVSLISRLSRERYDLVLDLFSNPRTSIWTAATRARVRVGYPGKGWRSRSYNRFVHPRGTSAVAFHLASIEALGWEADLSAVPRLFLGRGALSAARARLESLGVSGTDRFVVFHPGARWPTRQWGDEDFAAVARRLIDEIPDCRALILAGPNEEELARAVVRQTVRELCSVVSGVGLDELPAFLSLASAFVGGDSGPIHIAVASGTPTVAIFGRNKPEVFFPYPARLGHRAVYTGVWCSPCDLDVCSHTSCLRSISPEMVWNALREIVERVSPWPCEPALVPEVS